MSSSPVKIRRTSKKLPPPPSSSRSPELPPPPPSSARYVPRSPELPPTPPYSSRSPELPPTPPFSPSKSDIKEFKKSVEPPKLELPEPIPIPKKVKSQMDFYSRRQKLFNLYKGNHYINILFYLYLFNKYKSNCLIYDQSAAYNSNTGALLHLYSNGLTLDFTKITGSTYAKQIHYAHLNAVVEQIVNCINNNKSEIIIIPLTLAFQTKSHANVMIYRKFNNTVEHFEPHGSFFSYDPHEDKLIEDALAEFMAILNKSLPDVRFKPANQVCVNMSGLQSMEAGYRTRKPNEGTGYCSAWSMFFTELALKNPTIPSNELLDIIYNTMMENKKRIKYLTEIIQGYSYYIEEKLEKYYAILFGRPKIYSEILKTSGMMNSEFYKKLYYLVRIESMMINNKYFSLKIGRDIVAEQLAKMDPRNARDVNGLRMELDVYEKLIDAKKGLSPVKELLDDSLESPKKKTPTRSNPIKTRCPKGTRRNKKTGECELTYEDKSSPVNVAPPTRLRRSGLAPPSSK